MEIKTDKYHVIYDATAAQVVLKGSFFTTEYAPILELLKRSAKEQQNLTVDLHALEFINSSGINTLAKFITFASEKSDPSLALRMTGNKKNLIHEKLLKNLQRLMPQLVIELD